MTLKWAASLYAASYEYCYDKTNDNACTKWVSTTATSVALSGLSPNATYYWQVRAKNAGNIITYANGGAYWYFRVDNAPPKVLSITRLDPNPTTAAKVRFTVTFSEVVKGVDVTDFQVALNGLTGAQVTALSGSGSTRIVTASTGTGIGTLQLQLIDDDSIKDVLGRPLGGVGAGNGSFLTGQKYTLDRDNKFNSSAAQDGWILESKENSNLGGSLNSISTTLRVGDDALNKQYRSLLSFDTSGLPDNATIVSVTLKIKKTGVTGANPFTTHGLLLADIRKGYFGSSDALLISDFQAAPTGAVGSFSPVPGALGWYQVVLSPANLTKVNKLGLTQFRLRFALDDNNDHGADYVLFAAGEASPSLKPVLIVEYTLP